MTSHRVGPFWLGVPDHPETLAPCAPNATTPRQAAELAAQGSSLSVALRRHRELVDVHGRFRYYLHAGRAFVAKESDPDAAARECANARMAAERLHGLELSNGMKVRIAVPQLVELSGSRVLQVDQYLGRTLHDRGIEAARTFPERCFAELLQRLLSRGVAWSGYAPRNVICSEDDATLWLIDWEDAEFSRPGECSLDGLHLFRLVLNWSPLYGGWRSFLRRVQEYGVSVSLGSVSTGLDGFERTYRQIIGTALSDETVRSRCAEMCLASEAVQLGRPGRWLSADEVGHLVADLFDDPLQVLYSLATEALVDQVGGRRYQCFLRAVTRGCQVACGESGAATRIRFPLDEVRRTTLLVILTALDAPDLPCWERIASARSRSEVLDLLAGRGQGVAAAGAHLVRIEGHRGWDAARARSAVLDQLLSGLFAACRPLVGADEDLFLLLRGSLGQGLVSVRSDVDFEISGPRWKGGHPGLEALVVSVLNVLGIGAEGTAGRPETHDLVCGGGARDLHEWMELRMPGSPARAVWWDEDPGAVPADCWSTPSRFELEGHEPSAKHLFFAARAAVARLSFRAGFQVAASPAQLEALRGTPGAATVERLLKSALHLRESETSSSPADAAGTARLERDLRRFCLAHGLPLSVRVPLRARTHVRADSP